MSEIPAGYTRVTEIFQPFVNFAMIPQAVLANAADRGTRVHTFCEMIATNIFVPYIDADCLPYVESFQRWFDTHVDSVLYSEQRINSEEHMLSGAIDLVCNLKHKEGPYIIDIKTPVKASKTWDLQTAAYRMLLRDNQKISCNRMCLMLSKTGGVAQELEFHDNQMSEMRYLAALDLFRYFGNTPLDYSQVEKDREEGFFSFF